MWARVKKSWWYKVACWVALFVVSVMAAVTVAIGLALLVPLLATWLAWEWFVGRHKPTMTLEEELAELVRDHG